MKNATVGISFLVFGLLVLLVASIASAQDTASLTGTVRDQTEAVIPKAGVVVKNTANGFTRNLFTNSDGEYLAAALPAGHYDLTVTAKGFRK